MTYQEPVALVEGCIPLVLLPDHWDEALFQEVKETMDALSHDILAGVLTSKADVEQLPLPAGCRLSFVPLHSVGAELLIVE